MCTVDSERCHLLQLAILSRLLIKYEVSGNAKALAIIKEISLAAWRHIHLNGQYTHITGQVIDMDAIAAGLNLG
jgi:type V secretory pathway adhesin AidA